MAGAARRRLLAACLLASAVCVAVAMPPRSFAQTAEDATLGAGTGGVVTYFIADGAPGSGYRDGDRELALWALAAWERAAGGALHFVPGKEAEALVHLYWVPAGGGEYGETRPLSIGGRRGAAVYVRPDTSALGADIAGLASGDALFRDTIVYLTCLHELGHALGLRHTANYADVMYFFGYGGDIPGFFERYRKQLRARSDIAAVSGLSKGDLAQLRALYGSGALDASARRFTRRLQAGATGANLSENASADRRTNSNQPLPKRGG